MQDLRNFFRQAARNPENYRMKPADFTRKRKLHFSKLIGLMLSLLKKVIAGQAEPSFYRGRILYQISFRSSPKKTKNGFYFMGLIRPARSRAVFGHRADCASKPGAPGEISWHCPWPIWDR